MHSRIQAAREAQQSWGRFTVRQRVDRLRPLRRILASRMDALVSTLSSELGKPPLDALSGDMMVVLEHLRWCEKNAARLLRPRRVGAPPLLYLGCRFAESEEPFGVVLVLAPWNYPLQLSLVPATTALFAGNAVLLKFSEHTPRTAALVADCLREAGLPDALVSVSHESGSDAEALVDAAPDLIFFTGSTTNGRSVAQRAAGKLIPCILELGGNDACLIFLSANLDHAVEGAVYAAFSNAGQVCVAAKRIFVERSLFPIFLERFVARARSLRIGSDTASDIGPIATPPLRAALDRWVADALARGATLHTPYDSAARAVGPLILTGVPPDAELRTGETFGPIVWLEPFDDEADAIRRANDSPFALGASIFTGDAAQANRIATQLTAGSVAINDAIRQVGNPQLAFGGNRASGYGRYHGEAGLRAFSRVRSVMNVRESGPRPRSWFPFTPKTHRELRALLHLRHGSAPLSTRWRQMFRAARGSAGEK
jgi:acyl-CoA reductase-like NAD-dependent aldehyde dehydrogenase